MNLRIPCYLPGASKLQIEVWDNEKFVHDELIGATSIDLEDRFFSRKWRALHEYPIENRQLLHPGSSLPQGYVRCWVEIIPKDTPEFAKEVRDITPKPASVK